MKRSTELLQKRAEIYEKAKTINARAKAENRDTLNESEQRDWDGHMREMDSLAAQAKSAAEAEEREAFIDATDAAMTKPDSARAKPAPEGGRGTTQKPTATPEYRDAFVAGLRAKSEREISAEQQRALGENSGPDGGFLLPEATNAELVTVLRNANVMRGIANVVTASTDRVITMQSTKATAYHTGEGVAAQETGTKFKGIRLSAHKMTALAYVSDELIADSAFAIESYLVNELGLAIADLEEGDFFAGDGVDKPRGVINDATAATPFASATAITADEIMNTFHALPRFYRQRASWVASDSFVLALRKLTDAVDRYIWNPGLQAGQPDLLLGKPILVSDYVPSIATGEVAVLFGDFSEYRIVDRAGRSFARLNEIRAIEGQVAFLLKQRVDAALRRKDAVVSVKMA